VGLLPGTAAWIIDIAQISFAVLLILGVTVRWPRDRALMGLNWAWSVVSWLLLAILTSVLLIAYEQRLPSMLGPNGTLTLLLIVFAVVTTVLYATGAVTFTRYYIRSRNVLAAYIALDLILLTYNTLGIAMTSRRYALMWYTSRILAIVGGIIVMFGVLWQYVRLYQKEQEKSRELESSIAERKQAEEDLRDSEARLTRSQAIAHLGSWELDVVNDVLSWSDEVYRMFGLQPQEFKATYGAFLEAVHPDDRDAVDRAYSGSLREGKDTYEIDHRIVRKSNGEIRYVHERCHHVRDETGAIVRSLGMVHDITERKQAEEALQKAYAELNVRVLERTAELEQANRALQEEIAERREAEDEIIKAKEEWERTFDAITDPIMILDTNHRIAKANRAMAAKLGISPEEATGLACFECVHGCSEPPAVCPHARLLIDKQPHTSELHDDRMGSHFLVSVSPLYGPDGTLFGSVHYARDITEQKRAQEAGKAERQRLYDVLETLPVYVCLLTEDYHMPFANRYFRETFGESQGRRCHDFLFNRTQPCETCETYTVMKTRAPHHWYWTGPNGRDYDIYDFPFTDTGGSFLILEMGIDITERNKAEEALKQTLDELTRSNEDLQHFAYVASHDLQEPLRSVASALYLFENKHKGTLDGESDQLIHYAVDAAKKMKALILDLLTYSRITTRGKPFAMVNVQEVLHQSLLNLKGLIDDKQAGITSDEMPTVHADFTLLMQVFQNLIGNAVKFGHSESPKVHVSAARQDNEWIFAVRDNGIGISPEYFDRIFVIFQQLDKKGPFHGTGMGLAIVKRIVERHRGRVWVESQVGIGSTFYFTIPDGANA
jgi:PAS domain S-box-containing protein